MLIYANRLTFQGSGAPKAIFRSVGKWLEEKLGYRLGPKDLKIEGRYEGGQGDISSTLRVYAALKDEIEYYAWVLEHPDASTRGWKWNTEIGVKIEDGILDISFVVRIDGVSTRIPIVPSVSPPRVVSYVIDGIRKTKNVEFVNLETDFKVKKSGSDVDSYRALLIHIEKENKKYPIILVSPTIDRKYLLKTDDLQKKLIGLAQVIEIVPNFNRYDVEKMMRKSKSVYAKEIDSLHKSIYAGAIGLFQIPDLSGDIRSRIFRSETIIGWGQNQNPRISQILSWVTNETNVLHFRDRIRPEKISQLSMHQRLSSKDTTIDKYKEEIDGYIEYIEEKEKNLNSELERRKRDIDDLRDKLYHKDIVIDSLNKKFEQEKSDQFTPSDIDFLIEILCEDKLTPFECLNIVEKYHGDKCIVLSTAKKSAKESNFDRGRKLLKQLILLVTEYREIRIRGGGDKEIEEIFGSENYAPKEKSSVMQNPRLASERTFLYKNKKIEMFSHLKIGKKPTETKTIRTHFHWDSEDNKVIVGYCGKHLSLK